MIFNDLFYQIMIDFIIFLFAILLLVSYIYEYEKKILQQRPLCKIG